MKKNKSIITSLLFALVVFISCGVDSNNEKEATTVDDTAKNNAETSKDDAASESSPSNLPVVKAASTDEKYVDWGDRPVESEDEPADPWTMPFMMCNGPSSLDDQIKASSTLAPQGKNKYAASNVCDDDPTTAWVEGKSDYGVGEFIEMDWTPMNDGEISILNGYQSSKSVWENNSRVKQMKVSVAGKEVAVVELADVMGVQKFKIPGLVTETEKGYEYNIDGRIRFTIMEVYPGSKFKDTAISGIFSCGG